MGIESVNVRDGALSGFCSRGSANRFGGSRESDLAALGSSLEERLFHSWLIQRYLSRANIV